MFLARSLNVPRMSGKTIPVSSNAKGPRVVPSHILHLLYLEWKKQKLGFLR